MRSAYQIRMPIFGANLRGSIGRREQVGMYLRNQNIVDKLFQDLYKNRAECEKIHGHIKQVVKFDIRSTRNESKKLYSLLNFVAY